MSKYCKVTNTIASLNIDLDRYDSIILTLDGNQYQLDKDKIKTICKLVLPTSFCEVESKYMQDRDLVSLHHNYSNKLETLSKLLYLRDIYRNGWKPDWNSSGIKHIWDVDDKTSRIEVLSILIDIYERKLNDENLYYIG